MSTQPTEPVRNPVASGWKKTENGREPMDLRMQQIVFQIEAGRPYKEIAAQFGVTVSRISHIKRYAGIVRPFQRAPRELKPLTKFTNQEHRKNYIRSQLKQAMRKGFIIRPSACSKCGAEGVPIDAHHYKGYSWETRFDVLWLCKPCHGKYENQQEWRKIYAENFEKHYRNKMSDHQLQSVINYILNPLDVQIFPDYK